jgi:hypothetical protein
LQLSASNRALRDGKENQLHQTTHKRISSFSKIAAGIALTCLFATQAQSQDQQASGLLAYGMVGIAPGQSLRLHAVTVGVQGDTVVELSFFDRQGTLLSRSVGKLSPGQAASIIIHYTPEAQGNHTLVRALVRFEKPGGSKGYVIPSLEVVDDETGRTTVLLANPEG